jgi:amino acid transporter
MTSRTQSILGIIMWSFLLAVPITVLASGQTNVTFMMSVKENITTSEWMTAIFFGVYCYVGFCTILPAAEECTHPEKKIPAALLVGPIVTGILYVTGGFAIIGLRPASELLALEKEGPFASVWVKAMEVMWNGKGAIFMNCAAISTALTTANACVYGGARMLYGMARERQLPAVFRKISPGHKTPTVPILITGVFILICVLSGAIRIVSVIANFVFFPLWFVIGVVSWINLTNIKKSGRKYKEAIPFYIPGGRLWAGICMVESAILTVVTFLATDDVVVGGIISVAFFILCWIYYIFWKSYNKKKGIDIVAEAAKYESSPSDWK